MENKYVLGTSDNRDFLRDQRIVLLDFGCGFASPEGGAYYLGGAGEPHRRMPKLL